MFSRLSKENVASYTATLSTALNIIEGKPRIASDNSIYVYDESMQHSTSEDCMIMVRDFVRVQGEESNALAIIVFLEVSVIRRLYEVLYGHNDLRKIISDGVDAAESYFAILDDQDGRITELFKFMITLEEKEAKKVGEV